MAKQGRAIEKMIKIERSRRKLKSNYVNEKKVGKLRCSGAQL